MISSLTIVDILLSAFYIIVILILVRFLKPKITEPYYKYYFKFIYFKITFAVLFVIIYIYYFKGGDTFLYFNGGNFFVEQTIINPKNFFKLYFGKYEDFKNFTYTKDQYLFYYFKGNDILFTSRIVSIFCFLGFKQFLTTTILFTMFTAFGVWAIFTTMCKLYPHVYKMFAIGILFYPTIGIWGSGILKDPLTLMCVGLIFQSFYHISYGKKIIKSTLIAAIAIYICLYLKPYILYIFIPCMLFWLQSRLSNKIESNFFKTFIFIFLTFISLGGGYFLLQQISLGAGKYSLDNVQTVAEGFQSWHSFLADTRNQSGYNLGEFDFTLTGILSKAPEAFFVSYYRPFLLTEATNFSLLFEAIQTFILLILTILIFFKIGVIRFFRILIFNQNVNAFILFAILFGITVGITSYNFGALSRYKLPGMPFYTASLAIIHYLGTIQKMGLKHRVT